MWKKSCLSKSPFLLSLTFLRLCILPFPHKFSKVKKWNLFEVFSEPFTSRFVIAGLKFNLVTRNVLSSLFLFLFFSLLFRWVYFPHSSPLLFLFCGKVSHFDAVLILRVRQFYKFCLWVRFLTTFFFAIINRYSFDITAGPVKFFRYSYRLVKKNLV